jgi:PST family polysaccharide transporter
VVVGLIGFAVVANLLSSSEVFEVELLNRQRGTQVARCGAIQTIAGAILSIAVLLAQAPLLLFGSLPAIQAGIRAWVLALAVQAESPLQLLRQFNLETSRELIKRGWPLLLAGLSVMLYMKSDLVMLEWLRGSDDVGQYSVAVRVTESLYFLPVVLSNTFLPRLGGSETFRTDTGLRQLYRSAWLLGVGMVAVNAVVMPSFTTFVFGEQYLGSLDALMFLSPCGFAVATGVASSAWLNRRGGRLLKVIPLRTAVAMILNICLNLWLIPLMGTAGAALATSISYYFATFAILLVYSSETRRNALFLLAPL